MPSSLDTHFASCAPYGVTSAQAIITAGFTRRDIRGLTTSGDLERLRHGGFASSEPHPGVASAVRAGGVLSCISALQLHGAWRDPADDEIHTRIPPCRRSRSPATAHAAIRHAPQPASRDASPPQLTGAPWAIPEARGRVVRCRGHERLTVVRRWSAVDTPEMALAVALTCLDPLRLEVTIESALHERLASPLMIRELLSQAPARAKQTAALVTSLSGSGIETLLKRALRDARIPYRQQVQLGRYRVDFLVCDWLVVEVDGRAFHDTPRMWAEDAERDFALAERGFRVQRFTFHQIRTRMDQCIALVTSILATAPTSVARHSAH